MDWYSEHMRPVLTLFLSVLAPISCALSPCHAQSLFCGVLDASLIPGPTGGTSRYGRQVALEEDVLAVADYASFDGVRVFRASEQGWMLEQVLERPERADAFGSRLAVDSGRIFVYAPFGRAADSDPGSDTGSVFIYQRTDSTWELRDRIDLAPGSSSYVSDYGHDMDADGDHLLISREGVALFYHFDGSQWIRVKSTGTPTILGQSVSIDGERAVVPRSRPGNQNSVAEIWEFSDGDWSVTMSYELPYDSPNSYLEINWPFVAGRIRNSGVVWVHEFVEDSWVRLFVEQPGWSPHGSNADIRFDADYMYVCSASNNEVVIFRHEKQFFRWQIHDRIFGSGFGFSELGSTVSVSNGMLAVGALDAIGVLSVEVGCVSCPADFDGDLIHTGSDVQFFIFAFQIGASDADLDKNGFHNFFDVAEFLRLYLAGCPAAI